MRITSKGKGHLERLADLGGPDVRDHIVVEYQVHQRVVVGEPLGDGGRGLVSELVALEVHELGWSGVVCTGMS